MVLERPSNGDKEASRTHLSVLYYQVPGRENQSDKRSREEHFDNRDMAIVAVEDLGKGIGVEDAEAFCSGDSKTAVVLIERDEVEVAVRHGCGRWRFAAD
jgi:hypothetical protein